MPYESERQRKYMHANMPKMAVEWDKKYGSKMKPKGTQKRASKRGKK